MKLGDNSVKNSKEHNVTQDFCPFSLNRSSFENI